MEITDPEQVGVTRRRRMLWEETPFCHYCKRALTLKEATVDHKVPKSQGGTNTRDNLLIACGSCNNAKGSHSYEDFVTGNIPEVEPKPTVKQPPKPKRDQPDRFQSTFQFSGWEIILNTKTMIASRNGRAFKTDRPTTTNAGLVPLKIWLAVLDDPQYAGHYEIDECGKYIHRPPELGAGE